MPVLAPLSARIRTAPHSRSRTCPPARSRAAFRLNRHGFTLLELLVVIAVLGVATAIVAPRYGRSIARTRAEAAMERVFADIRRTQALARATSTTMIIQLDTANAAYTLPMGRTLDNAAEPERVELDESPYFVSDITSSLADDDQIVIDPYGRIVSTGSLRIRVGDSIRWVGIVDGRAVERNPDLSPPKGVE